MKKDRRMNNLQKTMIKGYIAFILGTLCAYGMFLFLDKVLHVFN